MKFLKLIALFILSISLFSCGDDEEATTVKVEMNMHVAGTALELGKAYKINNTSVKFSTLAMYIGDPSFDVAGRTYTSEDRYFLLKPGTLTFNLGEVQGKTFDGLNFNIGVDETTNALDEEDYNSRPAGDPLGVQDPSMHWSWNAGYRFARIDGKADLDNDGEFETSIVYHTGTNALFRSVSMTPSLDLKEGANTVEIGLNIADAFIGVDFSDAEQQTTHTGDNPELATKIADNLKNSVSVKLK